MLAAARRRTGAACQNKTDNNPRKELVRNQLIDKHRAVLEAWLFPHYDQ
jgi:hypothetical protein